MGPVPATIIDALILTFPNAIDERVQLLSSEDLCMCAWGQPKSNRTARTVLIGWRPKRGVDTWRNC